MHVEIRPAARLRGKNAVDLLPALGPALDAVIADPEVDLTRLRVTADWVRYRQSFRPPVMLVPTTVERRIERALAVVAPERLLVTPDCGLRHLPASIARAKLQAMTRAAAAVRARIAGRPPRL